MPRISIVDDDEQTRNLIRERLADKCEILDKSDPESAFVMTLQHKPDAILLDLSMPKLSGFELCQALSSLSFTRQIPMFIVRGQDVRNKAFCKNLGAAGYLEKPIDFGQLKSPLTAALTEKSPERRAEVRVQLRVPLRLKGKDKAGESFEADALTENMSAGGFLCSCTAALEEGATVGTFLANGTELHLGSACVVRADGTAVLHPRYHFKFMERIGG